MRLGLLGLGKSFFFFLTVSFEITDALAPPAFFLDLPLTALRRRGSENGSRAFSASDWPSENRRRHE